MESSSDVSLVNYIFYNVCVQNKNHKQDALYDWHVFEIEGR